MLRTFTKKAAQHWFKYAKTEDLLSAKIYESIRMNLERNFRTDLDGFVNNTAKLNDSYFCVIALNSSDGKVVWA